MMISTGRRARLTCVVAAGLNLTACATTESIAPKAQSVTAVPVESELVAVEVPDSKETQKQPRSCRSTQITGSKFRKKVCATREQWDELDARTERAKDDINRIKRAQSGDNGRG